MPRAAKRAAGHDHDHEPSGGEPDPHVWLSPPLLKIQAQNIAAALCRADPAHQADYARNLAALLDRLDALHRRIKRMLAPYRGRSFYVFHPGFGYFADAYGLKQEAVEAGGRSPTPKQLRALIEKARADGVQDDFRAAAVCPAERQVVAEAIGGKVVPINGLGKDVIADIEDIAKKIETALQESSPRRHGDTETTNDEIKMTKDQMTKHETVRKTRFPTACLRSFEHSSFLRHS